MYRSNALTHLAIYNVGSFNGIYRNSGLDYVRKKTWERAEKVSKKLDLPIVMVNSNIHKAFPQNHLFTHTYTDVFAIYALQKLWRTYYYASAYDYNSFTLKNNLTSGIAYEALLLDCLSLPDLKIYLEGAVGDRTDKIAEIADFPLAQKYLHVCTAKETNCGYCEKCMRTLIAIDALGKLDNFRDSFDIDGYRNNSSRYYRHLCKQHVLENYYYKSAFNLLYPQHKEEFDGYLSEYTLEKQIRKADEQARISNIWRSYTNIFEKSIDKTRLKENIEERFSNMDIKSIAFYGDGELRRFLYSVIKDIDGVEVKYIVEDGKFDWLPFPSYSRIDSELPAVDLMIITDVSGFPAIKIMIERDFSYDCMSAEELIIGKI